MKMTEQEFQRLSRQVKGKYGIDLFHKQQIVEGRLENYLTVGGWTSYGAYLDAVALDKTGKLERELVDLLTTNHTYFMREFQHLEFLKTEVIPQLKRKHHRDKEIRIWCGAASTGEEPYMLAMLLSDAFGIEKNQWDTRLLATDVSTDALRKAIAGVYKEEQLKSMPDSWVRRYFKRIPETGEYQVTKELKQDVIYRQFNLMDPFPFRKELQVVFLRNVMIYFDQDNKNELLQKVYDCMEPGGYLFIGKTETIDRRKVPFQMVQPSIFKKAGK